MTTIYGKTVDVEFEIQVRKNGGGSYLGTTLTYKDNQGKVQTKSWAQKSLDHPSNAHIKAALQTLTKGTNFQAEQIKNDAGFLNWTELKITTGEAKPQETKETYQPKASGGNWQTAEERAQTQIYIIRQNAITNAVNLLKNDKVVPSVDDVLDIAKEFEKHVLGIRETILAAKPKEPSLADLEDDIPY